MKTKTFEIRDSMTCMPALAVQLTPSCAEDGYLLHRSGFNPMDEPVPVLLYFLEVGGAEFDPFEWPQTSRTRRVAHEYIAKHFDALESGAVVDVEFILGINPEPKQSERFSRF